MATKINDTVEFFGNQYIAVEYTERPADFFPTDDDQQCRVCQLAPNFCKMKEDCHGDTPFVFVKSAHAKMMENAHLAK
jgi:hypothetical protein